MRTINRIIVVLLIVFTAALFAESNPNSKEVIEQNYIEGINSDNAGLRVSSAYFLGEIKSTKAVIPLMKMLRNEKCENARLMAALSLIKIGDARGVFMVKKTAQFNDFERVRRMAHFLYSAYLHESKLKADLDLEYAVANL